MGVFDKCIIIGIMVFSITIIMQVSAMVVATLARGNRKRIMQNGAITSSRSAGAKGLFIDAIKFTIVELSWFKWVFVKRQEVKKVHKAMLNCID